VHGTVSITANELPQDAASLRELALRQRRELEESAQQLEARDDELRILREYIRLLKYY